MSCIRLVSMLLLSLVCVVVRSAKQFCLQCTLESLQWWQWHDCRWMFQTLAAAMGKARSPMVLCNDRGTCNNAVNEDRRRPRDNYTINYTQRNTAQLLTYRQCCQDYQVHRTTICQSVSDGTSAENNNDNQHNLVTVIYAVIKLINSVAQ